MNDITNPTPARVAVIFESFAERILPASKDQIFMPSFNEMQLLEYPDLHHDALAQMKFFKTLYKIMSVAGIGDFGLRDIIRPEPGRFRRIVSAVINFAKFREERIPIVENAHRIAAEIYENLKIQEAEQQKTVEKVNNIRLQLAEQEPELQELKQTNNMLGNELREYKKKQNALTSEIEEIKKDKPILDEQLKNTTILLNNMKADCDRLESQIVKNPEQLKEVIADLNARQMEAKSTFANLEKSIREASHRLDVLDAAEKELVGTIKLMDDCKADNVKLNEARQKVAADKEAIESANTELRDTTLKLKQSEKTLVRAEDRIDRLNQHYQTKKGTHAAKQQKLEAEYEAVNQKRQLLITKVEEKIKSKNDFEEKKARLQKELEDEISEVMTKASLLKTRVDAFQEQLFNALNK
ncbi:kinetochore-associated Ndc80 complex subunit nuf2 [Nowakowskiella sp. JEL0407]|nr:kinetochore-associated Ndc80 complex subunit nuf2 [Nowakowskiella sp. JEL0407]